VDDGFPKADFSVASHLRREPRFIGSRRVPALEHLLLHGATPAAYATIVVKTGGTITAGQRLHTDRTYWTLLC
jgi:hypothetical protein